MTSMVEDSEQHEVMYPPPGNPNAFVSLTLRDHEGGPIHDQKAKSSVTFYGWGISFQHENTGRHVVVPWWRVVEITAYHEGDT